MTRNNIRPWNRKDPQKWLAIIQIPVTRARPSLTSLHSKLL